MSVEDPKRSNLSIADRKAILLFGNDSLPPAFERERKGINRLAFEDLRIGGIDPPPVFRNTEIREMESSLEDREFDDIVDQILGYKDLSQIENSRNASREILSKLGKAKWSHGSGSDGYSSSYRDIKAVLKASGMKDGDTLVDIGSSYGRVGCVVGANFPNSPFVGYEIVQERVTEAQRVAELLQLDNVSYYCQDVSAGDFEIPQADWFFLYDSLNDETITHIIEKIFKKEENHNARLIVKYTGDFPEYEESPYLELVSKNESEATFGESWIYRFKQMS